MIGERKDSQSQSPSPLSAMKKVHLCSAKPRQQPVSRVLAQVKGVEGLSKKKKGKEFMDTDDKVVIAAGRRVEGD